jgi:S-adenosylmethionine decarboxylase
MSNFVAPGLHLLIDFWGAKHLQDKAHIRKALKKAAEACGATVLKIVLHSFGEGAGITGVAVLSESHISIHTWPEINYIALDVFMCGSCNPHRAVLTLREFFEPQKIKITEHCRGKERGKNKIKRSR